jgi:aldehyde:ferredoxin oxidoreductase
LEPILDGQYQGFTIASWLRYLVYEYYRLWGRYEKIGRPLKETLSQLGLEELIEWGQPDE